MAAVLDEVGGLLGTPSFWADPDGYSALLAWLNVFGEVTKVGVEGTGSYGAGIAWLLKASGCPGPRSGPTGSSEAASQRQVRSPRRRRSRPGRPMGRANGTAKSSDGLVEAIRVLVVAKRSARGARGKALVQMRHLDFSAPEQLSAA